MILFSVQDFFDYLKAYTTMTGIQRVHVGLAHYVITHGGEDCGFVINDPSDDHVDGDFLLIPQTGLSEIIAYVSGSRIDHDVLRQMLENCEAKAKVVRPEAGDILVLVGAFWGHGNTLDRYTTARGRGAMLCAYVYDIIPITHPEFCDAELTRAFSTSIGELVLAVDIVFTISDATRHALAALLREAGARSIPMQTVPLAHVLTATGDLGETWPAALRSLEGQRYVAYVSTVEGRKNHLYVVRVWQELIGQGVDVPDLVFVGRQGWRSSGLIDVLQGTRYLGGRVRIVHDLTDAELNSVYAHCLFTAFTSFIEGWGLPVGESLVKGVPCVASSSSSIPEVGGDFVDYVDPFNVRDGVAVFRRMIEDERYRAARRSLIEREFVSRTWDDVGRDLIAALRAAVTREPEERIVLPRLPQGTKFVPGELVTEPIRMADYIASPMRLALARSFLPIEPSGAPMRNASGEMTFQTDLPSGTEIMLYLELFASPTAGPQKLIAGTTGTAAGVHPSYAVIPGRRNLIRMAGQVGEGGRCTLVLRTDREAAEESVGSPGIGLVAIGYAATDDLRNRELLLERFMFHDLTARR